MNIIFFLEGLLILENTNGQFKIIEVREENTPEYGKTTFPNMIPIHDYDYGLINLILGTSGIIGIIVLIVIILWRKRK